MFSINPYKSGMNKEDIYFNYLNTECDYIPVYVNIEPTPHVISDYLGRYILSINPKYIEYFPKKFLSEKLCRFALKKYPKLVRKILVPKEYLTEEDCFDMVKKDNSIFPYIPLKCITQEMCEYIVSKDGFNINYVPKELHTLELSIKAFLSQVQSTIKYIIPDHRQIILEKIYKVFE